MANFSIPSGYKYRFEPEDHELITYLFYKVNGEHLPSGGVIKEIDLYSTIDPGKLFERSQEKIVYVFTKVKKVVENGKRVDRKVTGNRTWKGVDKGHPIYDKEGRLVGEAKNFVFMNKMKMKLGYNMKEFVLDKSSLSRAKFKDYVLCKIKRKVKKERSSQEEDICSFNPAIKEERNAAIAEELNTAIQGEFNSSSTMRAMNLMPENSLVTNFIPSPQSAVEQYCCPNSLVTIAIPFSQSVPEQYSCQNSLVTDANPFPQSVDGQYSCQNSLVTNCIPFPQSDAEQYCYQNFLVTDANPFPQSADGQYSCQNSLVTNCIPFPQSDAEQYCYQNSLVTDANPFPQSADGQYSRQNSLVTNCIPFPQSDAEQYCYQNSLVTDANPFPQSADGQYSRQNSLVTNCIPFPQSDAEQYCCQNLLVTNCIPFPHPFPQSDAEQYCCQNSLVTNAIPLPQSDFEQYCQNSLVTNAIPFPESAVQYCQFSALQEGTSSSDQTASVATFDKEMTSSGFLEPSAGHQNQDYWMTDNMISEFAHYQEEVTEESDGLSIWDMIDW